MSTEQHYSVLLDESVEALVEDPAGFYVDGTFGRGGHSKRILASLSASGRLLAFDKDPSAVSAGEILAREDERFEMVHASFSAMEETLAQRGIQPSGLLLDLGVSSPQLDQADRGFSFMRDGPLDMRMDTSSGMSAKEWLLHTDPYDMVRVFKEYGEEKFAKKIALAIAEERLQKPLETTHELANLIERVVPKKEKHKHPATRVFQAIRIEINGELSDLSDVLEQSLRCLRPGANLVVISFHSLEDRIVKRFFKKYSQSQRFPAGVPVTHDQLRAPLKLLSRALKAGDAELEENTRSRSAVMRIAKVQSVG